MRMDVSVWCLRPHHVENTGSRPITEVKQRRARLVLGWVTAWEYRVLQAFLYFTFLFFSFLFFPFFLSGKYRCGTPQRLSKITFWCLKFAHDRTVMCISLHGWSIYLFILPYEEFCYTKCISQLAENIYLYLFSTKEIGRLVCTTLISVYWKWVCVYGHITLKTPVLVRSPKLSNVEPG